MGGWGIRTSERGGEEIPEGKSMGGEKLIGNGECDKKM